VCSIFSYALFFPLSEHFPTKFHLAIMQSNQCVLFTTTSLRQSYPKFTFMKHSKPWNEVAQNIPSLNYHNILESNNITPSCPCRLINLTFPYETIPFALNTIPNGSLLLGYFQFTREFNFPKQQHKEDH
jgi:hypothetical protein